MPKVIFENNCQLSLQIDPADKVVIAQAERVAISEYDSLYVLDILENPPTPNARLLAAAQALPAQA